MYFDSNCFCCPNTETALSTGLKKVSFNLRTGTNRGPQNIVLKIYKNDGKSFSDCISWIFALHGDIALMREAAIISETSVNFYKTTWHNNSEDSHLHSRHRKNIRSR
jgi:hypothetical protein